MTAHTDAAAPRSQRPAAPRRRRRREHKAGWTVRVAQLATIAAVLLCWQYLPTIAALRRHSPIFDRFFVSSPSQVWSTLGELLFGTHDQGTVWPYLDSTVKATLLGTAIGLVGGALLGLLLSNSPWLNRVFGPFVVGLNSVPRIALVPIVVIIFGPSLTTSVVTAVLVVLFLAFFNALEGGQTVPPHVIANARVLGASRTQVMFRIRAPYVLAWTFAVIPNALSFGLVTVVTAEILTGYKGMGRLLLEAISSSSSSLTFGVVIILTLVGLVCVGLANLVKAKVLHWWQGGRAISD